MGIVAVVGSGRQRPLGLPDSGGIRARSTRRRQVRSAWRLGLGVGSGRRYLWGFGRTLRHTAKGHAQ